MRGLTTIQPEIIRRLAGEVEDKIARKGAAAVGWRQHFQLAACRYEMQVDRESIRSAFADAARNGIAAYQRVDPELQRTPFDFAQLAGIVTAFGDADQVRVLAALPRRSFLWPESLATYVAMANALEVLQAYLGDRDPGVLSADDDAPRDSTDYAKPVPRAVLGLVRRDAGMVRSAIATLAAFHAELTRDGELKLVAEAAIAVLPLGLVQLARARDLDGSIESAYVPVELL